MKRNQFAAAIAAALLYGAALAQPGGAGGSAVGGDQQQTLRGGDQSQSLRGGDQSQSVRGGDQRQEATSSSGGNTQTISIANEAPPAEVTVKNTPDAYAMIASPTAPCRIALGAGVSAPGFGISLGSSVLDDGCDAREDARLLHNLGLQDAAILRLCQKAEMRAALGARCPAEKVPE